MLTPMLCQVSVVQVFTFISDSGQQYHFNINHAQELIAGREPGCILPVAMFASHPCLNEVNVKHAMTTDLTKPLIAVVDPEVLIGEGISIILIDGWHRVYKALATGCETLPAHVLLSHETALITMNSEQVGVR